MNRIDALRAAMALQDMDAFVVRDTTNIAYLTRFEGVFDAERAHALLVDTDGAVLHTDSRYDAACRAAAQGSSVSVDAQATSHAKWLASRLKGGNLGIEDSISLSEFRAFEQELAQSVSLVETKGVVEKLRSVKDESEVERLRAAQAIVDAAFAHIVLFMAPGISELDVQRELDNYMLGHGASHLAFPSIVACGANGANPHAQPTDKKLEAGQCVVMDFGACCKGYCSDMTRMVFIGQPDSRLADAYALLRACNEEVQATLKPGVTGAEAHQLALDILEAGGYGGTMGHGLGHGVGMVVHEDPVLSPRNNEALIEGNVVTVEPGIYLEGEFGMRLEDFGVIRKDGFEAFGTSTHDPVVV